MPPSVPEHHQASPPADRPRGPAEWIGQHQVNLWRYLRYLGSDPDLAEDLAQETFIAALGHGIEQKPTVVGQAWLRTTARNLYRTHLRRKRVRGHTRQLEELDTSFELQAHPDLGETYSAALDRCLQLVDGRGLEVLRLRFTEGASREEMAVAMGLSNEGVKTLLRRVKEQLRRCIEKRRQA